MRSRTSFFNRTLFSKTAASLWPLWAAYALICFIALPLNVAQYVAHGEYNGYIIHFVLEYSAYLSAVVCFGGATVCAAFLWRFMYASRSASGIASLPLRRENVFFSSVLAGIVPVVCINIVISLILTFISASKGSDVISACWQFAAMATLQYICFYGLATLCCHLTGNPIVAIVVYLIFSFVVPVVAMICNVIETLFIFGHDSNISLPAWSVYFSPMVRIVSATVCYDLVDGFYTGIYYDSWAWLGIYAAVGIVMLFGALAIYRKRRMETAGDVIALRPLRPVFKYCFTFGLAMAFPLLMYVNYSVFSSGDIGINRSTFIFLFYGLVGAFIGYFGCEMLLQKTFKVWRGKWVGYAVSAAIILVCVLGLRFDVLGVGHWLPDASKVQAVELGYSWDGLAPQLSQQENIEKAIDIHASAIAAEDIIRDPDSIATSSADGNGNDYYKDEIRITYIMKSGRTVVRDYQIPHYVGNECAQTEKILDDYSALRTCDEARDYIYNMTMGEDREVSISYSDMYVYLPSEKVEDFEPNIPGPLSIGTSFYLIDDTEDEDEFSPAKPVYSMDYEQWRLLPEEERSLYYCMVNIGLNEDAAWALYNACMADGVENANYITSLDIPNNTNISIYTSFRCVKGNDARWYYYSAPVPLDAQNAIALLESWGIGTMPYTDVIPTSW